MKDIIAALLKLLKPRTIITFAFVFTFCIITLRDKVDYAVLVGLVNVLMGFYFGETIKDEKNSNK